jgi:hypothetical protein
MMQRRQLLLVAGTCFVLTPMGATRVMAAVNEADAASGVRTALQRGAEAALQSLGRTDGFLGNAKVRIPLPGYLEDAGKLMRKFGQGKRVDQLETAMNRAAEAAVPKARTLLVNTIRDISVEDALRIVKGGDTAVTDYFARKTREPLGAQFLPIVTEATQQVDLAKKYNRVASKASGLGLVKQEDANVEAYVTRKALDGLYLMIGEEEKKIRADPLGTGSAILKKVFGL